MSFASQTKKELTGTVGKKCCKRAELSALIRLNGSLNGPPNRLVLDVTTENAAIARRIYTLLKEVSGVPAEVLVRKKMRLKKNNIYMVRVSRGAAAVLEGLGIGWDGAGLRSEVPDALLQQDCCRRAYMRGAFLAAGSVNNPEGSSYHLEITFHDLPHCRGFLRLMEGYDLGGRVIERKKGYVVYLKEGEKIVEFLNLIGAHQALLRFEDVRILKGMRNQVNRLVNCETANLNKTIQAAVRQIENIRLLERTIGLENLPPKLREVAELRLRHPEINLQELGAMLGGGVTKSGVNHRLRKLDEWARRVRESRS
ncbi:MAG: DNA-binding protein WhiA [Alicyclobacillaceae bacterium]|nr:DNA-binding protein WhiA [Alicyclobacillaceae bacterium]